MPRPALLAILFVLPLAKAEVAFEPTQRGLIVRLAHDADRLRLGPMLFGLKLASGRTLTALDLAPADQRCEASVATASFIGQGWRVGYRLEELRAGLWRVGLKVEGPKPVVRCDVVRLAPPAAIELGGFGQPWFLDGAWWAGVEYPASRQLRDADTLTCSHAPGRAAFESKPAVIGHRGSEERVDLAFESYLKSAGRPRRSCLQYNSWYDLRRKEMTVDNFARIFRGFQEGLLAPYGLRFDAFVPDDGWQNPQSIWEVDRTILPHEFAPLARLLEAGGSRLGLWMPLNGTNLDPAWGQAQGYLASELGGRHYQLTDPNYQVAIRSALRRRIEDGNLGYFKHDFNNFQTRRHPLGPEVDFEENLDAQLALHRYERELQPDIFLNVTSGIWLSPWWLLEADAIWMGSNDFGYERTWPQTSRRDWELSYRDQHFYTRYAREQAQYPLSRLMTHGIIHGRLNRLGGPDETTREWSDSVVFYFARGVQLQELYITPDLMTAEWWKILGRAIQWSNAHRETLDRTRYLGGQPRSGETYGYIHWGADEGIVAVRNPDVRAASLSLTLAERPRALGTGAWRATRIYPDHGALPGELTAATALALPAPAQAVAIYHLARAADAPPLVTPACPITGRVTLVGETAPRLSVELEVPPEAVEPELQVIVRSAAPPTMAVADRRVRELRGDGNVVWRIALSPGAHRFETALRPPAALFDDTAGTVAVYARGGVPITAPPEADGRLVNLPPLATRALLAPTAFRFPPPAGISDEELSRITAVRLRLLTFDSNGEPPYNGKRLWLNGRDVAAVPANPRNRFQEWFEAVIELTPDQTGPIGRSNTIEITNAGGDMWKLRGVALAVRRADGVWVASRPDATTYSAGGAGWLYHEGTAWDKRTPPLRVELPEP